MFNIIYLTSVNGFSPFALFLSQHDSVGLQGFELSVGLCVCVSVSVQFSKNVLCNISPIS